MRRGPARRELGRELVSLLAGLRLLKPSCYRPGKAPYRLRGLLARMSPKAPPPIKLCPAGALIPPPDGQNHDRPDREDQEIAQHDTFHDLAGASRSSYESIIGNSGLRG